MYPLSSHGSFQEEDRGLKIEKGAVTRGPETEVIHFEERGRGHLPRAMIFFYWRIVVLQCYVGFALQHHTSAISI